MKWFVINQVNECGPSSTRDWTEDIETSDPLEAVVLLYNKDMGDENPDPEDVAYLKRHHPAIAEGQGAYMEEDAEWVFVIAPTKKEAQSIFDDHNIETGADGFEDEDK